jgi:hypothetical protein
MQLELERVLQLQTDYSPQNTPEMQERGQLIRTTATRWLSDQAPLLAEDIGLEVSDFFAQGRDGTGGKTHIPWLRFGSRTHSPNATKGFYVVYLFDAHGDAVYLSLNQGTTDYVNGRLVPKPTRVLQERVSWARNVLSDRLDRHTDALSIELHDPRLGAGYERGNIMAVAYPRGAVPNDAALLGHTRAYAQALGQLYAVPHTAQPLPYETPEVKQAVVAAEEAAGKSGSSPKSGRSRGAGFRTNAAEIKLVETHAVNIARAYYERDGWDVEEYGKPFDLEVCRGNERLTVEVKGTTSDGSYVPLTAGEVRHHAQAYPNNALLIVRHILLDRTTAVPTTSGGTPYEHRGWSIAADDLQPISYSYRVPSAIYS